MVKTRTVSDRLRSPNFRSWSMRTSLADAFAVVRLQQIQEFHLWQLNTNAPNNPYSPLPRSKKPTALERGPMLLFHANVFTAHACLKHSYFFKVKVLDYEPLNEEQTQSPGRCRWRLQVPNTEAGLQVNDRNPTTSFLTATTLIYAIGAGITAAAGTRLALQLIIVKGFKLYSFLEQDYE